jgi:hypothetical protein
LTPQSFAAYDESMAEKRSRTSIRGLIIGRRMLNGALATLLLALAVPASVHAQPSGQSTYQRKGTYAKDSKRHHGDRRHWRTPEFSSQTSAGSFQRPYPYHLDYYRAKWGGSYAPYFGNLYGPPNYFLGTPYYGGDPYGGYGGSGYGGYGYMGGGYGREPAIGGVPYGPWQGQFGPDGAPLAAPVEGGVLEGPAADGYLREGPVPGF